MATKNTGKYDSIGDKKEKNGEFVFHEKGGDPIPEYLCAWGGETYDTSPSDIKVRLQKSIYYAF